MKPYKQLYRHKPEEGFWGDCHRTAIGCLLDLPPESVPHFMEGGRDDWHKMEEDWLKEKGLKTLVVIFQADLDKVLEHLELMNPNIYGLLGGKSRTGCGHTVVICGGKIVWDPSLNDSGIIGPMDDGFYWVTYFTPISLTTANSQTT